MAAELKACTNTKYRRTNAIIILIMALLTLFSIVMAVYNLVKGGYLFAAAWFIAFILAGTYVIIRFNTVFVTSLTTDRESLYMKNWSNDFLPYDYQNKIKFLSEFIPSKTKTIEVPIADIAEIVIGTKGFLKRNTNRDSEFADSIAELEKSKDFYRKRTISSMDIFYVETRDNECCYMPISQFDTKSVIKILNVIMNKNPNVVLKTSNRAYKRLAEK